MSLTLPLSADARQSPFLAPRAISRTAGTLFGLFLCAALSLVPVARVQAQVCWVSGQPNLDLGDITSAGGSGSGTLRYTCDNYTDAPRAVTLCLYMNPDQPDGVAPRQMVQWHPHSLLSYDLYSDPAHSQIIGSEGSGHAAYATSVILAPNGAPTGSINLHARVPAGQSAAAGLHESQMTAVLRYAYGSGATPPSVPECLAGPRTSNYSTVRARFANTCHVSAASDLDFGNASVLDVARDRTSTIQLQCPVGTVWRVALNDGIHAFGGNRRMTGPGGGLIRYELYRDASRNQRWGNTVDTDTSNGVGTGSTQSLTVYGRVPAQETPAAGTYSDTVTVTLTF